jgi:succinate dehydrogenase/fumarate reductase cytochrome b subunit
MDRVLERLFEVTSVLPLAAFALTHLAIYGRALFGATEIGSRQAVSGWIMAGEALGVWLPLGFHLGYAPFVWRRRREQESLAEKDRGWLALHRISGVVLALFLVDHWRRFCLPILRGDRYPAESVTALARELSTTFSGFPLLAGAYALGVLALSFHLGYGLWRIAERHAAPDVKARLRAACTAIAVLAGLLGTLTVVRLAAG